MTEQRKVIILNASDGYYYIITMIQNNSCLSEVKLHVVTSYLYSGHLKPATIFLTLNLPADK